MLPCKPNTPVYQVTHRWIDMDHDWCIHTLIFLSVEEIRRNTYQFGKSIFLSRGEAEDEIRKREINYEYDRMGKKGSGNCCG